MPALVSVCAACIAAVMLRGETWLCRGACTWQALRQAIKAGHA